MITKEKQAKKKDRLSRVEQGKDNNKDKKKRISKKAHKIKTPKMSRRWKCGCEYRHFREEWVCVFVCNEHEETK